MMGRPGSGRARKASISFPRSATTKQAFFELTIVITGHASSRGPAIWRFQREIAEFALKRAPGMTVRSGAGDEERRQPRLDVLRDFLGGTILGVTEGACAREALVAAGDVVGDTRERISGHDRFVGSDLDQIVLRIDADVLAGGQRGVRVDHQRRTGSGD